MPPEYFALTKIKEFISPKLAPKIIKELEQKIFDETNIEKIESEKEVQILIGQKRKKKKRKKNKLKFDIDEKKDTARKKKEDILERKHNKYCGDNIIKKLN